MISHQDLISNINKLVKLNLSYSINKKEIYREIVNRYYCDIFNEIDSNKYDVYDYRGKKSPFIKNWVRKSKEEFIVIYQRQYNQESKENLTSQQIKSLNKELDYHITSKIWERINDEIPFTYLECLNIFK